MPHHNKPKMSLLEQRMRRNEVLYHEACGVFGGTPRVFRYYSPVAEMSIDVLTAEDSPKTGVFSCATLGMMHHPVGQRIDGKPLRFELCGACDAKYDTFLDLINTLSVRIMTSQEKCRSGAVIEDSVRAFIPQAKTWHILLVPFDLWDKPFAGQSFDEMEVRWLTTVFITEKERQFMAEYGAEALISLLAENREKLFDPTRESLI